MLVDDGNMQRRDLKSHHSGLHKTFDYDHFRDSLGDLSRILSNQNSGLSLRNADPDVVNRHNLRPGLVISFFRLKMEGRHGFLDSGIFIPGIAV